MTSILPYSLSAALLFSGVMQRAAAASFRRNEQSAEERFSFYSSYLCLFLAAASFICSSFLA